MIVVTRKTFVDALNTSDIHSNNSNCVSSRRGWFFRYMKIWKFDFFRKGRFFPLKIAALRNNDIESQKNLACFQTYRTVVYKGA